MNDLPPDRPPVPVLLSIAAVLFIEGAVLLVPDASTGLALARPAQAAALILIFLKSPGGIRRLGFSGPALGAGIKTGLTWSLAMGLVTGLIAAPMILSGYSISGFFTPAPDRLILLITASVSAPLAEELFFRGLVYARLRPFNRAFALVSSAMIFSLCHGAGFPYFFIPFVGGLIFATAFERSKSLAAPFIIHSTGNTLLYAGEIFFSLL